MVKRRLREHIADGGLFCLLCIFDVCVDEVNEVDECLLTSMVMNDVDDIDVSVVDEVDGKVVVVLWMMDVVDSLQVETFT